VVPQIATVRQLSYLEAFREALAEEMRRDERVFIMGEDVSSSSYDSSATAGLIGEFGPARVVDTPLSETAFVGAGIGAAMMGRRPIVDLGIASFAYVAMDQLVNQAAKNRYQFGSQVSMPVVFLLRMYLGARAAAQHSDRPYAMFMNVPGLKVVIPQSPYDIKGLLKSAIRDPNPVMFFSDFTLLKEKEFVPEDEYVVPLGKARILREGTDLTLVSICRRRQSLGAADELAERGVSVEVIDPRSLVPLDRAAILASVSKTRRLVVADAGHNTCSAAAEICAIAAEHAFDDLDAPILRIATPDVHIPFSPPLEDQIYPTKESIVAAIWRCLGYRRTQRRAVR
jgi:pyruvate/2-oxoglutarate/acetoin dehydrogenase E1 component